MSQLRLGALVVKDATGVILGEVDEWVNNAFDVYVELADRPNVIVRICHTVVFTATIVVMLRSAFLWVALNYLGRAYFQDGNCVGIPFGISDQYCIVNETLYGVMWVVVTCYTRAAECWVRNRDGRDEPQGECHNGRRSLLAPLPSAHSSVDVYDCGLSSFDRTITMTLALFLLMLSSPAAFAGIWD